MSKEFLSIGKNKLTLNNSNEIFSLFLRKNGEIFICIDNEKSSEKYKLSHKSANIIADKLKEIANQSENIRNANSALNNDTDSFNYDSNINMTVIDSLLDEAFNRVDEQN